MWNINLAASLRRDFVGKNDYYARAHLTGLVGGSLSEAMNGIAPYDVAGNIITEATRESMVARLCRYRNAWRFYNGEHYENPWADGELKLIVNYCKKIVDISVDWFSANSWTVDCPSGNEPIGELLDRIWEANRRDVIMEKMLQYGCVTGDSFMYVTVETKDHLGEKLPKNKWYTKLTPLNPAHCFPIWNPMKPGEMLAILVQFPALIPDTMVMNLFTLYITPEKWVSYMGENKMDEGVNDFGKVNVVHIPNFYLADSVFGQSDIHQVIPLNMEYNDTSNAIRRIIAYHAEPTTVIFGAKVGDLDKGAKKVWSGLPKDAKVENLELQSDLKATFDYLQGVEKAILDMSSTPRVMLDSLGSGLRLSNTSGLAMQMAFQPIIEKTRKRRISYTNGIRQINELILIAEQEIIGIDITALGDDQDNLFVTDVDYTSPLPRDEQAELDAAQKKLTLGVWSRAEAIRQLSDAPDYNRIVLEIMADNRYDLAVAFETQRANSGAIPNLDVVFLSSITLSEDMLALSEASQQLEQGAILDQTDASDQTPPAK